MGRSPVDDKNGHIDELCFVMQLTYDENADSNLGPFTVDARLTSVGGSVLYATGDGRVSGSLTLQTWMFD